VERYWGRDLGPWPPSQFLCYPVLLHNSPNQKFLVARETNSIIVIERAKRTRLDDDCDWKPGGGLPLMALKCLKGNGILLHLHLRTILCLVFARHSYTSNGDASWNHARKFSPRRKGGPPPEATDRCSSGGLLKAFGASLADVHPPCPFLPHVSSATGVQVLRNVSELSDAESNK
jgi:hypothetical protein